jgi:hypothetical protein
MEMRDWYRELLSIRKTYRCSDLLNQTNLEIESRSSDGIHILKYAKDGIGILTIAVRLTTPNTEISSESSQLGIDGIPIACSSERVDGIPQGRHKLGCNEAIVLFLDSP